MTSSSVSSTLSSSSCISDDDDNDNTKFKKKINNNYNNYSYESSFATDNVESNSSIYESDSVIESEDNESDDD